MSLFGLSEKRRIAELEKPATITMGTLVGHFARCVLTSGANPKHHALLLAIPVIDALLSMIIVRIILNFMGISC